MSLNDVKIKQEAPTECDSGRHENVNVFVDPLQARPQQPPEFVSVKVEHVSSTTSAVSTVENEVQDITPPPASQSIKSEPMQCDHQQQNSSKMVEITIKQEPPDQFSEDEDEPPFEGPVPVYCQPANYNMDSAKFNCTICQKAFVSRSNLQRHVSLHTREEYKCNVCDKVYLKKILFDKHVFTHTNVKAYKCDSCEKSFKTSSNLQQHRRIHLEVKPFLCEICHKRFAHKANLLKHVGKSRCKKRSDKPLVCEFCNKVFEKEFLLKSHLRSHNDEKPFSCNNCSMSFKYKSTLVRHLQLHDGLKPYACKVCGKGFTNSGLIKPHMRKHTGEKPYQCPVCEKHFSHKHNMLRHQMRHTKVKRLVCSICNKKFPRESRLRYHMRTHTKEKPFQCLVCTKTFSHKQNVLRHYTRKHPTETYESNLTDAGVAKTLEQAIYDKLDRENISEKELPADAKLDTDSELKRMKLKHAVCPNVIKIPKHLLSKYCNKQVIMAPKHKVSKKKKSKSSSKDVPKKSNRPAREKENKTNGTSLSGTIIQVKLEHKSDSEQPICVESVLECDTKRSESSAHDTDTQSILENPLSLKLESATDIDTVEQPEHGKSIAISVDSSPEHTVN